MPEPRDFDRDLRLVDIQSEYLVSVTRPDGARKTFRFCDRDEAEEMAMQAESCGWQARCNFRRSVRIAE